MDAVRSDSPVHWQHILEEKSALDVQLAVFKCSVRSIQFSQFPHLAMDAVRGYGPVHLQHVLEEKRTFDVNLAGFMGFVGRRKFTAWERKVLCSSISINETIVLATRIRLLPLELREMVYRSYFRLDGQEYVDDDIWDQWIFPWRQPGICFDQILRPHNYNAICPHDPDVAPRATCFYVPTLLQPAYVGVVLAKEAALVYLKDPPKQFESFFLAELHCLSNNLFHGITLAQVVRTVRLHIPVLARESPETLHQSCEPISVRYSFYGYLRVGDSPYKTYLSKRRIETARRLFKQLLAIEKEGLSLQIFIDNMFFENCFDLERILETFRTVFWKLKSKKAKIQIFADRLDRDDVYPNIGTVAHRWPRWSDRLHHLEDYYVTPLQRWRRRCGLCHMTSVESTKYHLSHGEVSTMILDYDDLVSGPRTMIDASPSGRGPYPVPMLPPEQQAPLPTTENTVHSSPVGLTRAGNTRPSLFGSRVASTTNRPSRFGPYPVPMLPLD